MTLAEQINEELNNELYCSLAYSVSIYSIKITERLSQRNAIGQHSHKKGILMRFYSIGKTLNLNLDSARFYVTA